eukprot:c53604_g1_i1 orf=435-1166(-)
MAVVRARKLPRKKQRSSSFDLYLLLKVGKILLSVLCLVFCVVGLLYVYPFVASICMDTMPNLWVTFRAWLTPPVLFVFMNLVVGVLAVNSGFVKRKKIGGVPLSKVDENLEEDHSTSDTLNENSVTSKLTVSNGSKSKTSASVFRLVRSKSEQISLLRKPDLRSLKKFGTIESTSSSSIFKKASSVTSNVIVGDNSPDDEPVVGGEEVDKKAEAFIGRFYQQMRLQRLESLLRYKDRIQGSQS